MVSMKKKTRDLKTWSKHNVPGDIWPEILSRLPVKTLLRFCCVCRSWRALIKDPNFARLHLTRFNNNNDESHLFVVEGRREIAKCFIKSSKTLRTTAKLEVLQTDTPSSNTLRSTLARGSSIQKWSVICSTDGLLMLRNVNELTPKLMAWNPSIKKTRILPPPPQQHPNGFWFDFGLGFDSLLKDYKHVKFAICSKDVRFVAIYTFGTNLWKTIKLQGHGSLNWTWEHMLFHNDRQRSFCFRGILYALAGNPLSTPTRLISFDLSKELCASYSLSAHGKSLLKVLTMADGGNSIAIVSVSYTEGSVWVLDGLGSDDSNSCSWTKRYTFSTVILQDPMCLWDEFLYLKKNGEMFLNKYQCKERNVTSYNLETRKEKVLLKRSLNYGKAMLYKESLLLL